MEVEPGFIGNLVSPESIAFVAPLLAALSFINRRLDTVERAHLTDDFN